MEKLVLEIGDILDCVEEWFKTNKPCYKDHLNGPAPAELIEELVEMVERELPEDFVQLYQRFNGAEVDQAEADADPVAADAANSLFDFFFMPLQDVDGVISEYETFEDCEYDDDYIAVDGPIKPMRFSTHWVPFEKDFGGNFVGVDLDPPEDGRYGQVIKFGADEVPTVLAPSLAVYLMERCKIAGIPLPDPASKPKANKRHTKQTELKTKSESGKFAKVAAEELDTVSSTSKKAKLPIVHDPSSNVVSIFSARSKREGQPEKTVETVTILDLPDDDESLDEDGQDS